MGGAGLRRVAGGRRGVGDPVDGKTVRLVIEFMPPRGVQQVDVRHPEVAVRGAPQEVEVERPHAPQHRVATLVGAAGRGADVEAQHVAVRRQRCAGDIPEVDDLERIELGVLIDVEAVAQGAVAALEGQGVEVLAVEDQSARLLGMDLDVGLRVAVGGHLGLELEQRVDAAAVGVDDGDLVRGRQRHVGGAAGGIEDQAAGLEGHANRVDDPLAALVENENSVGGRAHHPDLARQRLRPPPQGHRPEAHRDLGAEAQEPRGVDVEHRDAGAGEVGHKELITLRAELHRMDRGLLENRQVAVAVVGARRSHRMRRTVVGAARGSSQNGGQKQGEEELGTHHRGSPRLNWDCLSL